MKPVLIYCYDAYCGWCYGFSPVIKQIAEEYRDSFEMEVLSGGMILLDKLTHIACIATYIQNSFNTVVVYTVI